MTPSAHLRVHVVMAFLLLVVPGAAFGAAGDGNATAIASGESHSVALLDDGTMVTWGRNDLGQLGNGTWDWRYGGSSTIPATPARVLLPDQAPLDRVVRISGGYHCPIAVRDDGSVWSWGYSGCRPSDSSPVSGNTNTAAQVFRGDGSPLVGAVSITGGVHHGVAVLDDGTVWSWGASNLGTGLPASGRAEQVRISATVPLTGAVDVAGKFQAPLVRLSSGEVYQWSGSSYAAPVLLEPGVPISDATELEVGSWHNLIKRADGTLWAWGSGASGQLGNGSFTNQTYPVQVLTAPGEPLTDVVDMEGTSDYTLARTSSGTIYAWGSINGSAYAQPYAAPVGAAGPVEELATGSYQALVRIGGRIYNRGSNWAGQLADPSGADSLEWIVVNARPGATRTGAASDAVTGAPEAGGMLRAGATRSALLELSVADVDPGQDVTAWVEIVPVGTSPSATCGEDTASTFRGDTISSSGERQLVRVAVSGLADGQRYTWRGCLIDARDAAGMWSTTSTFLVDETPPAAAGSQATDIVARSATFTLSATDVAAGLHATAYSFDDGVTWQADPTFVYRDLPWGVPVRLLGRVRDAAGNVSAQVPLEALAADLIPPRVTPVAALRGWVRHGDMQLSISDAETGVVSTTATFRGRTVRVRDGAIRVRDLAEGHGTIRVVTTDAAGNSTTWTHTLSVDRTAPLVSVPPSAVFGRTHVLSVRDGVSGPRTRGVRVQLRRLGANTVAVRVSDRAGNVATRRVRVMRHLSLARPRLNVDVIVRHGSRSFIADQHAVRSSFRFVGHYAPWYARTQDSPALVREAQWRLQRFGYLGTSRRALSGILDIRTIRAVQRYQTAKGLPRLGTIGPRTRAALDADLLAGRRAGTPAAR